MDGDRGGGGWELALARGVVFAAVFLAALLASSLPARKAARVQPADALRYQ